MNNSVSLPYIGCRISLVSKSDIRYEGILYGIDPNESTVALSQVRSLGTEGRKKEGQQIPPSNEIFDYILFKSHDIKEITVLEPAVQYQQQALPNNDPAIVSTAQPAVGLNQSPNFAYASRSSFLPGGVHSMNAYPQYYSYPNPWVAVPPTASTPPAPPTFAPPPHPNVSLPYGHVPLSAPSATSPVAAAVAATTPSTAAAPTTASLATSGTPLLSAQYPAASSGGASSAPPFGASSTSVSPLLNQSAAFPQSNALPSSAVTVPSSQSAPAAPPKSFDSSKSSTTLSNAVTVPSVTSTTTTTPSTNEEKKASVTVKPPLGTLTTPSNSSVSSTTLSSVSNAKVSSQTQPPSHSQSQVPSQPPSQSRASGPSSSVSTNAPSASTQSVANSNTNNNNNNNDNNNDSNAKTNAVTNSHSSSTANGEVRSKLNRPPSNTHTTRHPQQFASHRPHQSHQRESRGEWRSVWSGSAPPPSSAVSNQRNYRDFVRSGGNNQHVAPYVRGPARQTPRTTFKEAFNFEQNNAKLDLDQVAKEFEQIRLEKALEEKHALKESADATDGDKEITLPPLNKAYDPSKSFFDSLSCESLERATGEDEKNLDRRTRIRLVTEQRKLDAETFGKDAVSRQSQAQFQQYQYGGGYGRHGGYGHNNYNHPPTSTRHFQTQSSQSGASHYGYHRQSGNTNRTRRYPATYHSQSQNVRSADQRGPNASQRQSEQRQVFRQKNAGDTTNAAITTPTTTAPTTTNTAATNSSKNEIAKEVTTAQHQ